MLIDRPRRLALAMLDYHHDLNGRTTFKIGEQLAKPPRQ